MRKPEFKRAITWLQRRADSAYNAAEKVSHRDPYQAGAYLDVAHRLEKQIEGIKHIRAHGRTHHQQSNSTE